MRSLLVPLGLALACCAAPPPTSPAAPPPSDPVAVRLEPASAPTEPSEPAPDAEPPSGSDRPDPDLEAEQARQLGRELMAQGEALFAEAEKVRARALALGPPAFRGAPTDAVIRKHLTTAVADWIKKRRDLESEAERAYHKVLELRPVPPPKWVVASASRLGSLYEALPNDLSKVPVPASIRRDPKLLAAYQDALTQALEPHRARARAAYRICQQYSQKFGHADEHSAVCDERLRALGEPTP